MGSIIVGGTASELGGGKFTNGAMTGAFVMLFNHLEHQKEEKAVTQQEEEAKEFPAFSELWENYPHGISFISSRISLSERFSMSDLSNMVSR